MIILFNQNGSDFEIIYENETWTQGDYNAHSIKAVILNEEVDVTSYSGFISFLRDGETNSSPRLAMFYNDNIVYNGTTYKGFEFRTNSGWYTEIAGNLKCTIEIAKYTDSNLTERKAYGVVNINVIESAYTEQPSTITNEEYLALVSKVNLIDSRSNIIGQGNYEFNGDKIFNGSTRFEQEVILNYAPQSLFSAVSVGYVVNGYYDKSYIDNVVNQINSSIDTINATQNVIDIVPNYANLQNYVANHPNANILSNDKIEVLEDETQDGANTIYTAFLNGVGEVSWALVGSKSPYYSRTEIDNRFKVADVVQTSSDFNSYDASNLKNGDLVLVIEDNTQYGQANYSVYYKWNGTDFEVAYKTPFGYPRSAIDSRLGMYMTREEYNYSQQMLRDYTIAPIQNQVNNQGKELELQNKILTNLELANKGITYTDEVDSDEALVKSVPTNAMPYALLNKVGGKTLKVVQVHKITNDFTKPITNGIKLDVNLGNQTIRYYGTIETEANYVQFGLFTSTNIALMPKGIVGHKYLIRFNLSGTQPTYSEVTFVWSLPADGVSREIKDTIVTCNSDSETNMYASVSIYKGATIDFTIQPQIFDLTAMFGAGNEPTSVEEFNKYFPQEYYEFTEGEFIESKPTNVKIIGKNLFDISKTRLVSGSDGISITKVTNNSVTITTLEGYIYNGGISTGLTIKDFCPSIQVGKTYILNAQTQSTLNNFIVLMPNKSGVLHTRIQFNQTFTLTEENLDMYVYLYGLSYVHTQQKGDCVISNIQIEEGTTATDYEEYKESNLPINVPFEDLGKSVGNVSNYIDFENKKFVKNCKQLTITSNMITNFANTYCAIVVDDKAKGTNVISKNFKIVTEWSQFESSTENCIFVSSGENNKHRLEYKIVNFTTRQEYVDAFNSGFEEIIYEIINPTEEDVSAYLPEDNYIEVEGNGNIVFENTENTAIPSEVEYQVKVGV